MAQITRYGLTGPLMWPGVIPNKTPSTVTGQVPAASRYRYGYRLQWVTRALLFMGLVAEKGAGRCAPPLTRPATN